MRLPAALTLLMLASAMPVIGGTAKPDILLITLDTTRADALGAYGGDAKTPNLDRLAAIGLRYSDAVAPAPLTLPSHISIMTGRDPRATGVHDNGTTVLPSTLPTLAAELRRGGYATAAFVASRVLDRRFGLDRGFDLYDDRMAAERIGEYGYAERDAGQVASAAMNWIRERRAGAQPLFVWVHFYDPHHPYVAPGTSPRDDLRTAYLREVAFVDAQFGLVAEELAKRKRPLVTAAVADHGESLGEHGESTHGIFVYRSTMAVPLLIGGAGIPAGVVREMVSIQRLAATLLRSAGVTDARFGSPLPFAPTGRASRTYGESHLPRTAYGWHPLESWSDGRWKLIDAPQPELYDLKSDPSESRNLVGENRRLFFRMKKELDAFRASAVPVRAPAAPADAELDRALRSLGYLSGGGAATNLDPKQGIALLGEYDRATGLAARGRFAEAVQILQAIVRQNPSNVPFLTELGSVQLRMGKAGDAVSSFRRAVALNPRLDLLHYNLADALLASGDTKAANDELELTVKINPRHAAAWMRLAQIALQRGESRQALAVYGRGRAAGTHSASLLTRMAQLELKLGLTEEALGHAGEAIVVADGWVPAHVTRGEILAARGRHEEAKEAFSGALRRDPGNVSALLGSARALVALGRRDEARRLLDQVVERGGPEKGEAERILVDIRN